MRKPKIEIKLTTEERQNLEETTRTRTAPYRAVQRARLVLLVADGIANKTIAKEAGLSRTTVVMSFLAQLREFELIPNAR